MEQLQIGYGRTNITPDYPVAMAGGASTRISEGYLDPIYITFIAIRQGTETFLVATMDFVGSYEEFAEPARKKLSQATGIPEDHIILNSTHTHSSVSIRYETGVGISRYREDFYAWAVEAAKTALEDLTPAEVWCGSIRTQGMTWVRHYKMADGTYAGANYGSFKKSTIVGHASVSDPEMQVIKFVRTGGKQDVVLMNLPAHATLNQKEIRLSADFPGPARDYVAEKTGALVAYFIAGAGDQVPSSRVEEENYSRDYQVYGKEVGRIAVECLKDLKKLDTTDLRFRKETFTGESNKVGLDRLDDALAVEKIWEQVGGRGTPEGRAAAKEAGFSSVYAVTAILNRSHFEPTRSLELKTLSIGNLSFIFAPYEMFGASAMYVKEHSPYDMTFVVSCSQNHDGYLPSTLGWQLYCYEAQITRYAPGTAEKLAETFTQMLHTMKNQ